MIIKSLKRESMETYITSIFQIETEFQGKIVILLMIVHKWYSGLESGTDDEVLNDRVGYLRFTENQVGEKNENGTVRVGVHF